ncbi:hypothetical protein SAMN05443634_10726 [Chishuiella changwenlii]|jgi:hypothetical protein|uniref:Uncharacterized protein n=1 Tax=Chishuiella changwenlii TaxID=1434701 RepID=A0A1M6YSS6_9FLAO|nr:hypothetical protein [Chishuiella changwenlii]GGE88306.1 hypothetical protein GCM10010984_02560 [Chishuiella changwenlii]SHL21364.1 hypothetical protein SAMN05443634_10726 [Chishuiella changwenlii]
MGVITDLFFAIGDFCKWTFENLLSPIGVIFGWLFTFIGIALMGWWLNKLAKFGNDNEKKYDEI